MTDTSPRCGEAGMGHGDSCVLRPGHAGDHVHQPRGLKRDAARTWSQKPSLAESAPKPEGIPGQRDDRTTSSDGTEDQRTKRDE